MSRIDVETSNLRDLVRNIVGTDGMIDEMVKKSLKMLELAEACRDSQGQKFRERLEHMRSILRAFKNVNKENIQFFKLKLEQAKELEQD